PLVVMLPPGRGRAGRTLVRHLSAQPGFEARGIASMPIFPPMDRYANGEQVAALYARMLDEVRAIPGGANASAVSPTPLSGEGAEPAAFMVQGMTPSGARKPSANVF